MPSSAVLAALPLHTEFRLTHHRPHQHHRRLGFTFVELLVAMMVFGALSAVAVPRYRQVRERAYTGAMRSDLAGLRIAQEAFWAENQAYTTDTTQLDWRPTSGVLLSLAAPDPVAGYDATAVHVEVRGLVCTTSVGRVTASGAPSGEITCGAGTSVPTGAGTPSTPPSS